MIIAIDLVLLLMAGIALWRRSDVALCDFNREATVPLRAILALFVIFTHVAIWSPLKLGTEAVSVFLFMSGYGMCRSFAQKGQDYLKGFVRKHFVGLFLPFVLCSVVWVARMYLGNRLHGKCNYNGAFILKCISAGNFACLLPNSWFPIELFVLGLLFVVAFRIGKGVWRDAFILLECVALYLLMRYVLGWGAWWWLTIGAFPVGVAYANCEEKVKQAIRLLRWRYPLVLAVVLIVANYLCAVREVSFAITGCVVALVLYVLPLPRCKWLLFLGGVSYEIYLTHGMVYNVLAQCGMYEYLATVVTVAVTPLCAFMLQRLVLFLKRK